ncbi:MAG: hypothetical protein U5M53_09810 [Rhodoferax sp.]|nr:hypothetical protein [Rhodoferax sp.]
MSGFLIQIAFLAALPAIFVGGAAALSWQQLGKPWIFVCLALIVFYAAYVVIFYLWPSQTIGYTLITKQPIDGAKNYTVASHNGEVNPLIHWPIHRTTSSVFLHFGYSCTLVFSEATLPAKRHERSVLNWLLHRIAFGSR